MADTPAFNPATAGWEIYAEKGLIDLVGPLWERRKDGILQLGLLAEERHVNTRGVVHGGTLLTLLDQALGVAAWVVNGGAPQATVQLDVQFVAAVQPGEFIEAECRVVRQTRSLLFIQGTCTVGARRRGRKRNLEAARQVSADPLRHCELGTDLWSIRPG